MKNMTLENIAAVCGGTYFGAEEAKQKQIKGAVIDSRLVEKDYLFIPIKGARADGHQFIPDVFEKGALAVLSERELENPAGPYILVDDAERAMQQLAAFYRRSLSVKVVGITGSVGKTSTKEMIASVLGQKFCVLKTEGNLNNGIGLPLTIFQIREEHEVAVLEMGISEFGEMHRLAEMANPDICVITNIGTCHLEGLHDRDGILRAKTECFDHMRDNGIAVLNGDDDKLGSIKAVNGRSPVFYGMCKEAVAGDTPTGYQVFPEKSAYASDVEVRALAGTKAVIHIASKQGETVIPVEIPIAGEHNIYNALAAASVAVHLGLNADEIRRGIESVQTISGRSNLIQKDGITVIDDCYNANPDSMKASVNVLAQATGRKIAVLGDMGELGKEERALHYMVGEHFAGKGIDALFCTGTLSREIAAAVHKNSTDTEVHEFDTKEKLIETLQQYKREGDTILVKASHFMGFPEIVKQLTE
ncbi:MAG: UDP-N-acetylmuramoyl-tripeptide--D-alanyl-D-alanine ligase [Roseburia sp.]|nr:UDP-N-acetylmuramoyl-tripeptide--D-alanyl-D-alanine ligase [Roseburia sp.]